MSDDGSNGAQIAENGWRQGAILLPSLVRLLISESQIPSVAVSRAESCQGWFRPLRTALMLLAIRKRAATGLNANSDRWMVISQDCDLLQAEWSKEPYVEIIRICPAEGNQLPPAWGQSPREMQFSEPPGEKKAPRYVCSVHSVARIDRKYLIDSKPDASREFDRENVKRICRWISRRYVRAAFPDAFNERVKSALDSLADRKSQLNKQSDLLTGVYVLVTEAELKPHEVYDVLVWATMRKVDFEEPKKHATALEVLNLLEAKLGGCTGIDIVECELKSEQDITLDHLHQWKRWDFDVLSLRPKRKNDPLPPVDNLLPEQ